MRLLFSALFIVSSFWSYALSSFATEQAEALTTSATPVEPSIQTPAPAVIEININAANDGWDDGDSPPDSGLATDHYAVDNLVDEAIASLEAGSSDENAEPLHTAAFSGITDPENKLPGKDVNFRFKLNASGHFLIDGRATSDLGKITFKSKLTPTNEVKLSITLKQGELDDISLVAYIDLANFTLELDGGKSALNKDHKRMLELTAAHLQPKLEVQYQGYDMPEHAMMLTQMLGYWSVSPEGYVHAKQAIVSE